MSAVQVDIRPERPPSQAVPAVGRPLADGFQQTGRNAVAPSTGQTLTHPGSEAAKV